MVLYNQPTKELQKRKSDLGTGAPPQKGMKAGEKREGTKDCDPGRDLGSYDPRKVLQTKGIVSSEIEMLYSVMKWEKHNALSDTSLLGH